MQKCMTYLSNNNQHKMKRAAQIWDKMLKDSQENIEKKILCDLIW